MWLWRESSSTRLAVVAAGLTLVASVAWVAYLIPAGGASAPVIAVLAVPVMATAMALGLGRSRVGDALYLVSAVLLLVFVALFGLSFGVAHLPAAAFAAAAVVLRLAERRQTPRPTTPARSGSVTLPAIAALITCIVSVLIWIDAWYAAHTWGDERNSQVVGLALLLPVAIATSVLALHRTPLRRTGQVTAGVILLIFLVAALPAYIFALLYLPAIVLLLVSGLTEQVNRSGPPRHSASQP